MESLATSVPSRTGLLSGALLPWRRLLFRCHQCSTSGRASARRHSEELWSACQAGRAPLQDLVQQHRRRGGDVERRDAAAQRQGDELVAGARDARAQTRAPPHRGRGRRRRRSRARRSGRRRGPPRRRRTSSPPGGPRARKSARLRTRATARCSTAPAEAFATAGVTAAARRSGRTTPSAPAHSAVRQIAPTFWGSWTSSRATSQGSGPGQQRRGVGVRVGRDERAQALVGVGAGPLGQLVGADDLDVEPGQPRLARRPGGGPDAVDRPAPGAQRLADGVAAVEDLAGGAAFARRTARPRRAAARRAGSPRPRPPPPPGGPGPAPPPPPGHTRRAAAAGGSSGDERRAVGAVAHLPAAGGQLVAQAVGLGPVPGGPRVLAAAQQVLRGRVRAVPAPRRPARPPARAPRASRPGPRGRSPRRGRRGRWPR